MYFVYILQSLKDGNYYVGVTKNLKKRLREHNTGTSKSTAPRRPFNLAYSEKFADIKKAYKRERWIKRKKSKQSIKRIIERAMV